MVEALSRQLLERLGAAGPVDLTQPGDHSIAMVDTKASGNEVDQGSRRHPPSAFTPPRSIETVPEVPTEPYTQPPETSAA